MQELGGAAMMNVCPSVRMWQMVWVNQKDGQVCLEESQIIHHGRWHWALWQKRFTVWVQGTLGEIPVKDFWNQCVSWWWESESQSSPNAGPSCSSGSLLERTPKGFFFFFKFKDFTWILKVTHSVLGHTYGMVFTWWEKKPYLELSTWNLDSKQSWNKKTLEGEGSKDNN